MFWMYLSLPLEFDVLGRVPISSVFNWRPLLFGRSGCSLLKCLFKPYLVVSKCLLLDLFLEVVGMLEVVVVSGRLLVLY